MEKKLLFTEDEIREANEVNLVEFLRGQGEEFIPAGRSKRLKSDHSVTVCENKWYDHSAETGGYPVQFLKKFYDLDFKEAVATLLGRNLSYYEDRLRGDREFERKNQYVPPIKYPKANASIVDERKPFVMPTKNDNMKRTFAYLTKTRGIDYDVVSAFAKAGSIMESKEYHQQKGFHFSNCVFLGLDENGKVRHGQKQSVNSEGKSFKQTLAGSEAAYSFHHKGNSGRLYVFEAPIDMLSYICFSKSMNQGDWQNHSYVALCGVGGQPIEWMTGQDPQLREICFCLDNDEAGHSATSRFGKLYMEKGYQIFADVSSMKDWNEEWKEHKKVLTAYEQSQNQTLPTQETRQQAPNDGTQYPPEYSQEPPPDFYQEPPPDFYQEPPPDFYQEPPPSSYQEHPQYQVDPSTGEVLGEKKTIILEEHDEELQQWRMEGMPDPEYERYLKALDGYNYGGGHC